MSKSFSFLGKQQPMPAPSIMLLEESLLYISFKQIQNYFMLNVYYMLIVVCRIVLLMFFTGHVVMMPLNLTLSSLSATSLIYVH